MKKITLLLVFFITSFGFSQEAKVLIQNYLTANKAKLNLTSQDISDWTIDSEANSDATKITNYYIKQRYQGIEIYNAISNVWVKNNEVINVGNRFYNAINSKVNTTTPALNVTSAFSKALTELNLPSFNSEITETVSNKEFQLSNGNLANDPIIAELVYQSINNSLKLAWDFRFYSQDLKNLWSIRIDATTGKLLEKNDMVISCKFDHNHLSQLDNCASNFYFSKSGFKSEINLATQVQGGSYRVIPYNYESPNHIARQLITNPENAIASPNGWHNANTLTGTTASLNYTYTRGNNAWAKADYGNTNPVAHSSTVTANGYAPTNAGLIFDYPYSGTSLAANTYINAAVTNLFYMNNIMHDVWAQYGFDAASGNFQSKNYNSEPGSNDQVYAEAQDGSTAATPSFNNANFATQPDGTATTNLLGNRMQMYVWNIPPTIKPLFVESPVSIAGNYTSRQNGFSPGHVDAPISPASLQSELVLYNDGTFDPGTNDGADACGAAINAAALNGKIALIRRSLAAADGGSPCNFTIKVKNAQLAGAVGVIIFNNIDVVDGNGNPVDVALGMSGADGTITIPAIGVSKIVGEQLLAQLALTSVTVKLQLPSDYVPFVSTDGDFDNGIIAHEYGHGISNRLTGGRLNTNCLENAEQSGEGWSDWFALMMQLKSGDISTTPKGIGTFAVSQTTNAGGIRRLPYTTDMSLNTLTFNDSNVDESHDRGEFMTTVLWDLTWAYIDKYGFDSNIYSGTGGNNKVMRRVIDGLKLQPCSPSIVEFRDAIIAADQATTGGLDYCMIWKVFARRGLGVNASSGSNQDALDQVQDFTEAAPGPNCTLAVNYFENDDMFKVYPNPSNGIFNIRINQYTGKVNMQVVDINGRIVKQLNNEDFNVEKSFDLSSLQSGVYVLKINNNELNYSQKIIKN